MVDYFHRHLGVKIFFSYLVIIVLGVTVLVIASQFILPTAFNHHMMSAGMMENDTMGMDGSNPMSHATQRIADGRYKERVQVVSADELAGLAFQ